MILNNIAVHGVPRAGTSWLGSIFDSSPNVKYNHQPLFSYRFKSFLNHTSSNEEITNFFELLSQSEDDFTNQTLQKDTGLIPSFKKESITHVVYKEARYHNIVENLLIQDNEIKLIGIIRNPKSVLHSWYNAPKEFDKNKWNFSKEWLIAESKNQGREEEFYGYLKWKEFGIKLLDLKNQYPNRVYIVNYKTLLDETNKEVQSIFDFCGLNFSEQTARFLNKEGMQENTNPYSVYRKNQADDKWKNNLPKDIISFIDKDLKGTRLEQFLYE